VTKVWTKKVGAEADFTIDWADDLEGDTIATSTWPSVETGIVVGSGPKAPSNTPTTTTIWLSGGTTGQSYSLVNQVGTTGGRTFTQAVELRVIPTPFVVPDFSGCVWPVDPACFSEVWDTYDDVTRDRALALASATLYRLCGYRVGGCPLTVRPSRQNGLCTSNAGELFGAGFTPLNWNGVWANVGHLAEDARLVDLPGPVGEIIEVRVDGAVVDEANYSVIDGHYLAWVGPGDPPWPLEQDWILPDTEVGTFSVTYLNAYPVDALGAYAAGLLAMEFAAACASGGKKCKLPSNVVNIVRQGVSYEMSTGAFPDGKTTIREVDAYIEQWNPKGRRAGMVFNPGRPKVHVHL
jgi:hypothetical protein